MSIPFLASPNHAPRCGASITDIVLHWMDGTLAAADATFANATRETSAHYGVEGKTIHQYVADSEAAWHSGDKAENQRSIGIEHSADPDRPATAETIATSVGLIVSLCRRYGISPDHIYPHKKFTATACPGTLPVAAMADAVRGQLTTAALPDPMEETMKPWFFRAKSGAIVIVTPTGLRPVSPAQWSVWTNLGYKTVPNMSSMDPGPFDAVIASLGGLAH